MFLSTSLKNVIYYFKTLFNSKTKILSLLTLSVLMGLFIPLINITFPKIIVASLAGNPIPLIFEKIIGGSNQKFWVFTVIVAFFVFTALIQAIKTYVDQKINWYAPFLRFKLKEKIQHKIMTMEFLKTEDKTQLNKIQTSEFAIQSVDKIFNYISNIISSLILIITYSVLVFNLHPILIIFMGFNLYISFWLMKRTKLYEANFRTPRAEIDRRKNYLFQTMFDYGFGKEIRIFALEKFLEKKFIEKRNEKFKFKMMSENKYVKLSIFELLVVFLREALVYGIAIWIYYQGKITIDNFVMYIGLFASFSVIIKGLIDDLSKFAEMNPYMKDFREFIQEEDEEDKGVELIEQSQYAIEFKNVSFTYPGQTIKVLQDISFILENGKHTSLVGLNGAGKSTIVKLICRLYEPTHGEILLNGVNINKYNKKSYYQHITPVFQDSKLYAFTVEENIVLGKDCDKDKLMNILDSLGMKEKIMALNEKENTQVLKNLYDEGVEFSGGEKQRLCIARAMYKGGGVLLLDEPTAALDPLAEKKIYEGFSRIANERTTLFISHRLNSNRFCDYVIFMEQGKIIAQGSHELLMESCGEYRDIYNMQAQYYIDAKRGVDYETV